jgi:hypothetical protein
MEHILPGANLFVINSNKSLDRGADPFRSKRRKRLSEFAVLESRDG